MSDLQIKRYIYQYKEYFQYSGFGEELLPKVGIGINMLVRL